MSNEFAVQHRATPTRPSGLAHVRSALLTLQYNSLIGDIKNIQQKDYIRFHYHDNRRHMISTASLPRAQRARRLNRRAARLSRPGANHGP